MSEYVDWMYAKVLQKARVVDEDVNILALKRTGHGKASRPGKWDLPGGSIGAEDLQNLPDGAKPHLAAIGREVLEETGLVARSIRQIFLDSWSCQRSPGTILGIAVGYEVQVAGVKPAIRLNNDEHVDKLWGRPEIILGLDFGDDGGLHPAIIQA